MAFIVSAIFIPIIAILVIIWGDSGWSLKSHDDRIKCLIYLGINLLLCLTINTALYYGATSKTRFNEVLNYKIVSVEHWEQWTTRESRTERYACGTDSDGDTKYCTRTVYYTETHGPYWYANDNLGNRRNITSGDYAKWSSFWANQAHIKINRGTASSMHRAITGKVFQSIWDNKFETIFPYHRRGTYVNKIRASDSSLNRDIATEAIKERFPRPADTVNYFNPIVNYSDFPVKSEDQLLLRRINAKFGVQYQIHVLVLLFDANEDGQFIVQNVLNAWNGTNKNELAIFIGLQGSEVKWAETHSWSDSAIVHSLIDREVRRIEEFSFSEVARIVEKNVKKNWKRKSFSDFDYLQVRIHFGWIIGAYIATLIVSIKSYYWSNVYYGKFQCRLLKGNRRRF